MNISQWQWTSANGLQPKMVVRHSPAQLALLFGTRAALQDQASMASIRSRFPSAILLGCSTAGEILDTRVYDETVSVTAISFDATRVAASCIGIANPAASYTAGATLARSFAPEGLVHLFVLSDGLNVNGSELV